MKWETKILLGKIVSPLHNERSNTVLRNLQKVLRSYIVALNDGIL